MNVVGDGDAEAPPSYLAVGSENYAKARKARAALTRDPAASIGALASGLVDPRLLVEIESVAALEARWEEGTR